jgi:hypothetical protein
MNVTHSSLYSPRRRMTAVSCLAALMASLFVTADAAVTRDFSRYEVILSRMPFGTPSPEPAQSADPPGPPPKPASQSFVRTLRLCALKKSNGGVKVGFIDISQKPERSYLMYVGESVDGIEVAEADFIEEKALLRKDGEEYWIYMDGRATDASGEVQIAAAPMAMSVTSRGRVLTRPRTVVPPDGSYLARLRDRREALAQRNEAIRNSPLQGEALEKHLQDYNLDLIRQGMPALPIPLTEDQDQQLVQEGFLPPE